MLSRLFTVCAIFIYILLNIGFTYELLPDYYEFTQHDKLGWIGWFTILGFVQFLLLVFKVDVCKKCTIWSNFLLQIAGVSFIVLSGTFAATYPPMSWAMVVLPVLGLTYLVAGRVFSQQVRLELRENNGATTTD